MVVEQGPCQGHCTQQDVSSPGSAEAARGASRMGMVWQVLSCWSGTVDVLVSLMSRFEAV